MHTKPGIWTNWREAAVCTASWLVASLFCVGFWVIILKLFLNIIASGKVEL